MASNRLQILVNDNNLDYKSAEDLGIKFNRVVDDFTALDKRFGDFSYTFNLPITKNNARIFNYAQAHGNKDIFRPNQDLSCKVYNNDRLLLDGVISLQSVTTNSYNCVFYSKLKEFSDAIEDKNLRDLEFEPIVFDYEDTIIDHINAGYANSDDTLYQFPFIFYGTTYTSYPIYEGKTDFRGRAFDQDSYAEQQYYYAFNTPNGNTYNRYYHHQFPPAFYIVRLVEQIFTDAGWTIGGQWINDENIKKIVMLYAGDNDIYDQASGQISGDTANNLRLEKLLPDMEQVKFLNGIINMFNLYLRIDTQQKIIRFETHDTMFGDEFNPYDITSKVKKESVVTGYEPNNDPSIEFNDSENLNVLGDNTCYSGTSNNNWSADTLRVSNSYVKHFFNRVGTTDTISIPFAMPNIKKSFVWNDYNVSNSYTGAEETAVVHPIMSRQTPYDNENQKFNKNTGHTYVFNTEDSIKHRGKPCLMYYHGTSSSDRVQKTSKGAQSDYMYLNIYTGGTQNRVPIGFCSPMQISTYRDEINDYLSDISRKDRRGSRQLVTASYLQAVWNQFSDSDNTCDKSTDFSLVFDDNGYFHDTLWTRFHEKKYLRYQQSEILSAEMRMNDYDWEQMQINRPISYNNEIYHIVKIEGYDPVRSMATIKLIKTR